MKLLLAFSILFSILFQSCADSNFLDRSRKDQSVLQGFKVPPNSPFAKSIVLITQDLVFSDDRPFFFGLCTGLIISKRVVLTAAHCLDYGHKTMKIILNSNPRENLKKEEVYSVLTAKNHPSYDMKSLVLSPNVPQSFQETFGYKDIALVMVDRDFPIDSDQMPPYISLPQVQNPKPEYGTIAGFGKTTALRDTEGFDYRSVNGFLKQGQVRLRKESFIDDRILLSQQNDAGVCKGDSGAPLFVFENGLHKPFAMAIGVFTKIKTEDPEVSSGFLENGCAHYGVYLLLEPVQKWIIDTEAQLSSSINIYSRILSKN